MESRSLPLAGAGSLAPERRRLVRRARLLAWLGIGWHAVEAAIAFAAGVVAGSIALVGFGADSLIESAAGFVLLWRFAGSRSASDAAEARARRLVALSFHALAAYVAIEAARTLVAGHHPSVSWPGIALAAFTVATMPMLAAAKARVADGLRSAATRAEGRQNLICAYLSGALLIGLGANAIAGWWWADPVAGLVIAGAAVREGRAAWRGDACCGSGGGGACAVDRCA